MNAVIYARYSSAGQRDVSIEDQIREIESYAKHCDYTIIHTYADRATSGRTDKRQQFLQMITDAERHTFQYVLVYKHDRFARNKFDSVIYKKKLKDHGVKVIAVAEPIPDGHGAKILESIYEAMAEEYSENLSQNIKRGQTGNALKCMANHMPPFGYKIDKDTHKYVIDPENAPYLQTAYAMILQGKQHKDILNYLAEHGKPHSKHWLYQTLHNERYTGVYIYGETRIENGMPQLVSKDDFEKVQEIMKRRQQKPQLKPFHYLFSGIIYCGYCGSLMCGESATSHTGKLYRYYTCPTHKHKKQCKKKRIAADFIEAKATEALKNVIFTDEVIERLATDVYAQLTRTQGKMIDNLTKRLAEIEKSIGNIMSNVESNPHVPTALISRMCDLEKEKDELSGRIAAEQFAIDSSEIKKDDLKEFIRNFNQSDNRSLVNTFVSRITVYDDYAILEYDASGDNEIRIDFCTTSSLVEQNDTVYKITNGRLYIKVQLKAA